MKDRSMSLSPIRGKVKAVLLCALAIAAFAVSAFPSIAMATTEGNFYEGRELPSHVWTVGNGKVITNEKWIEGTAETTSSVCVGPVTYNGSYHMPYGWGCHSGGVVAWLFSPITAMAGIYNPNPGALFHFQVFAEN